MRIPRVSIRTLMAAVTLVAINCVIYRSLASRPGYLMGWIVLAVPASLPMWNILAIAIAVTIRRRFRVGPFWVGFQVCGLLAVLATLLRLKWALDRLESVLAKTGFESWAEVSPIRMLVCQFLILVVLPLLIQLMIAVTGGGVSRWFWNRYRGAWVARPVASPLRGLSLFAMLFLVAATGCYIEGFLRWKVDPKVSRRFAAGSEAIIGVDKATDPWALLPVPIAPGILKPGGTRLLIESDSDEPIPQLLMGSDGQIVARDVRMVRVRWLEGDDEGKTAHIPYCNIRQITKSPESE